MTTTKRILVIRLGALGDFILSFPAFAAIRAHHPDDRITLLTTAPFAGLALSAPWFDTVIIDARPAWWNLPAVLRLRRQLENFDQIYDLQTSNRTAWSYRLATNRSGNRPQWSGIAKGASHPHSNTLRDFMHTRERQLEQLEMAGLTQFPTPTLDWLPPGPTMTPPYALLVPGAAPHRPKKRWPTQHYAELATHLAAHNLTPIIIGSAADTPLATIIQTTCPQAIDLTGKTTLADLFPLAANAALAIGNDTGPMHAITAAGCPSVVLFSADSDPALTAPRGPGGAWPRLLREPELATLSVERVIEAIQQEVHF